MANPIFLVDKTKVFPMFKKRKDESYKGNYGTALLVCGSYSMAGAAILCAKACLASGVGICNIVCPKSIYPIVSNAVPEAVFTPLSDEITAEEEELFKFKLMEADCVVIGCGIGVTIYSAKLIELTLKNANSPIIIDADGINTLVGNVYLIDEAKQPVILTPHEGEATRITRLYVPLTETGRINFACKFAYDHHCIFALKGHQTITANTDGSFLINTTGNPGMATGGSGDLLCGIIAAFVCDRIAPYDATVAAVFIHGLAGDLATEKYSMHSNTPSLMLEMLPTIFKEIESAAQ